MTGKSGRIIMSILEDCAANGLKCPNNDVLSEAIGAKSASSVSPLLHRLEGEGLISVERGAINRVVTILATGKKTAGVVKHRHWRFQVGRPPAPPKVSSLRPVPLEAKVFVRVDRDPCPRCGTRADVGCCHQHGSPQPQAVRRNLASFSSIPQSIES